MQLPLFNALNKFSNNSSILSWFVYCAVLFAGFFLLSFEQIPAAEVFFREIGEIAVASSIIATVFYLFFRYFKP
jgi:hypothetical protein